MHSTLNPLSRTQRTLGPLPSSAKLCAYIAAPIDIKFLPKLCNLFWEHLFCSTYDNNLLYRYPVLPLNWHKAAKANLVVVLMWRISEVGCNLRSSPVTPSPSISMATLISYRMPLWVLRQHWGWGIHVGHSGEIHQAWICHDLWTHWKVWRCAHHRRPRANNTKVGDFEELGEVAVLFCR